MKRMTSGSAFSAAKAPASAGREAAQEQALGLGHQDGGEKRIEPPPARMRARASRKRSAS